MFYVHKLYCAIFIEIKWSIRIYFLSLIQMKVFGAWKSCIWIDSLFNWLLRVKEDKKNLKVTAWIIYRNIIAIYVSTLQKLNV